MTEPAILASLTVMLFASLVRSTIGFGEAMIAMPLLTMLVGIGTASPLIALTSTTIAAGILVHDGRKVEFSSAWRLVLAALLGIPIGAYVLTALPESTVKIVLAVLIIGFAIYSLTQPRELRIRSNLWSYAFGFVAGTLGGAYNTQGPPLVVYGTFRGWSPERFRATLQSFFFPTSLAIVAWHAIHRRMTPEVLWLYVASLPILVVSLVSGHWLNRRFSGQRFTNSLHVLLIVIGISLLINSIMETTAN